MYKVKRFSKSDDKSKSSTKGKVATTIGSGLTGVGLIGAGINEMKAKGFKKEALKKFVPEDLTDKRVSEMVNHRNGQSLVGSRFFLSNEHLLDPRGKSSGKYKKLMEDKWGESFYEPYKGKGKFDSSIFNKTNFTEDEVFNLKNDLDSNFSKENLKAYEHAVKNNDFLKDKARHLDIEENKDSLDKFKKNKVENLKKLKKARINRNIGLGLATAGVGLGAYGVKKIMDEKKSK